MMKIGLMGFELVDHPAYSPDLAPMDFKVFPVVKSAVKGLRFDISMNSPSQLKQGWYVDMF